MLDRIYLKLGEVCLGSVWVWIRSVYALLGTAKAWIGSVRIWMKSVKGLFEIG